ncbi:MAG: hypothetical protein MUE61_08475 [Vicinamibacterales bacterium]|jgi:hypothetical protein|nr:hypothetical protein [Vicinamibacterales bacterium]MCU0477199.1 hypothetical protein [Chloroflexota bacterium]MCU0562346.1 hypothetical protein [Desulfobacterales bacterium]
MNGVLVPRSASCWVCQKVAVVEDVTVRLFTQDGSRRADYSDAAAYLRATGYSGVSDRTLKRRLAEHARHVEVGLQGGPAAPGSLTRVAPPGPSHWLDVNQNAVDVGNEALGRLHARLDVMEDRELVAVAKLGVTAAQKVGDWEAKGRKLAQVDELIRLASGRVSDPLAIEDDTNEAE